MKSLLNQLGWNSYFQSQLENLSLPEYHILSRISTENKTNYRVITTDGEMIAEVPGKFLFTAGADSELPKVGDWVVATRMDEDRVMIHHVLDRRSKISRKAAGKSLKEQIIATNIDVLFIVQSLDANFNVARMERYIASISGEIQPVILLSKADICSDIDDRLWQVSQRLPDIRVIVTSALNNQIEQLLSIVGPEKTFAFVGSSGVGKSTLINKLVKQERQETREVRETDSKGKHTTTRREIILMEGGGILIDTPGMREFQPWINDLDQSVVFEDIEKFSASCRYSDCQHLQEDGCAVKHAVESGEITAGHYENYLRLKKEMDYLESKVNIHAAQKRKQHDKQIHKAAKRMYRKGKGDQEG